MPLGLFSTLRQKLDCAPRPATSAREAKQRGSKARRTASEPEACLHALEQPAVEQPTAERMPSGPKWPSATLPQSTHAGP
eukprot:638262-Prorocentrum_lima.AAC.1